MTRKTASILLLGNYRPTLTLARNLKAKGWSVVVGARGCDGGAEYSRAVAEIWDHPDPAADQAGFISALEAYVQSRPDIQTVFPVAEEYVRLFAEQPAAAKGLPGLVTVPAKTVNTCLDKMAMLHLADRCQVPTAAYGSATDAAGLLEVLERIGYPAILRSMVSTVRLGGKKAVTVNSAEEVGALGIEWDDLPAGIIAQRKFSGRRHNFYFAAYKGRLVRELHAVIVRTDRPDGSGLAVEGITITPDSELKLQTEALLAGLGYSGIGCAQYLVDETTGDTSFLEINARIAGNHAVPDYAGLDLEDFLMDTSAGKVPDLKHRVGRSDISYAWTTGDLMAAKESYLRGEISAFAALKHAGLAVLKGLRADVDMVFSSRDIRPGIMALWGVLPRLNRWQKPANEQERADEQLLPEDLQVSTSAKSQGSFS